MKFYDQVGSWAQKKGHNTTSKKVKSTN